MADAQPLPLPSGVVTFLLSDVEGSTRLWAGDEADMGAAIARHYALLDAAIARHGGVRPAEQGEGDTRLRREKSEQRGTSARSSEPIECVDRREHGVVGAFARPSDALAAAVAAARAFAAEPWPAGRELRIRLALHTGETQLRGQDYYVGRTVIRCARLRGMAHGGQTLLSSATRDLVADRLPDGVTLRDLGNHRLKDLGAPERVWQLCHPDLREDFPQLRSLDVLATNLPAQLTSFVGRDDDLREVLAAVGSARLVTLVGSGGAGKTRLGAHAVAQLAERHANGARWISLAPLSEPEMLPFAVARQLGVHLEGNRPARDSLCERIAGMDALLALDNCEHVIDACARLVEQILATAPGVRVLATSREPLGLPGEVLWRVPPLTPEAGRQLFVDRARTVRPGFDPHDAELVAVDGICRRLDGIPLAIELAAARVRMMAPERIAAGLDDRFRLLTGGGRTALPRQQTLELSVAWSHELLDEPERVLFRRLSVFAGNFLLDAVEEICAEAPLDRYAVLDLLGHLVDKSLVHVEHSHGGRYRLLETIRLYAAQRLFDAGEADALRERHVAFFLELVERAAPQLSRESQSSGQADVLDDLAEHLDNIAAAFTWCLAASAPEPALRLATGTAQMWRMRGRRVEGTLWLTDALAVPGKVAPAHRLAALVARNFLDPCPGPAVAARISETFRLARACGDRRILARALAGGIGFLSLPPLEVRAALDEALVLASELDDADVRMLAEECYAIAQVFGGEPRDAAVRFTATLELAQARGNLHVARGMRTFRGIALLMLGQGRSAVEDIATVAQEAERASSRNVAMCAWALAGWAHALSGAHEASVDASARAATGSGFGDNVHDGLERFFAGMAALARGEASIAIEALRRGSDLMRSSPTLGTLCPAPLAEAWLVAGNVGGAREIADAALARTARPLLRWQAGWARHVRARIALADGDPRLAEHLGGEALALRVAIGDLGGTADTLELLARLHLMSRQALSDPAGGAAEATRLCAAAVAARETAGCRRLGVYADVEELLAQLRDRLGDEQFATEWGGGAALTPEQAATYATRGRGERRRPATGWAALTPAEAEVARLVAEGLRNKEIAERLFVSPRTVQTHLANTFAKLGLSSRMQVAHEVHRHRDGENR